MAGFFWRYGGWQQAAPDPAAPAVEVRRATVRYPGIAQPALRDVSLTVDRGTRIALVGPNGSGKSTLLKLVAGLLPLAAGEARVFGLPVGEANRFVAYLPQRGEVDWRFPINVETLVLAGRYGDLGWLRRPSAADHQRARQVMARLGIERFRSRQVGELSGGQQQRAMLARAIVQDAGLLLLDEPMNAIDTETREVFWEVMDELRSEGKTALVATHDVARLQSEFDGVLYLCDGEQVAAPAMLVRQPEPVRRPAWAS